MTPPHERRNFSKIYEKLKLSQLSAQVPAFNFTRYLDIVLPQNLDPEEEVVIYASKYFKKLTKIVEETDKRVLANYILMRFIRHRINNLDKRLVVVRILLICIVTIVTLSIKVDWLICVEGCKAIRI